MLYIFKLLNRIFEELMKTFFKCNFSHRIIVILKMIFSKTSQMKLHFVLYDFRLNTVFYCMFCSYNCFIHFYLIIILIFFFLPCLTLSSSNMCTATIVKPTTLVNQTTYICNLINPLLNLNMIIIILKQLTIYKYG